MIWNGTIWNYWKPLNISATSTPVFISEANDSKLMFVLNPDSGLSYYSYGPHGWSVSHRLGGNVSSAPTVVLDAGKNILIFIRGTDGYIWSIMNSGGKWSNWSREPFQISSSPFAINTNQGILIYGVREGGGLYYALFS